MRSMDRPTVYRSKLCHFYLSIHILFIYLHTYSPNDQCPEHASNIIIYLSKYYIRAHLFIYFIHLGYGPFSISTFLSFSVHVGIYKIISVDFL